MKNKVVLLFFPVVLMISSCDFFSSTAIDAVIAGVDRDNPLDGDFWEPKTRFPGPARSHAVLFYMDNTVYYGLGHHENNDNPLVDMWTWSPETELWTELVVSGDHEERDDNACNTFIYDNTVYILDGNRVYTFSTESYVFTEVEAGMTSSFNASCSTGSCVLLGRVTDTGYVYYRLFPETWQIEESLTIDDPVLLREPAFFSLDGKIYTGGGRYPKNPTDTWDDDTEAETCRTFREYDPDTDTWSLIPDLPETASWVGKGFALSGTGYVLDEDRRVFYWSPGDTEWTELNSFPEWYEMDYENSCCIALDTMAFYIREWTGEKLGLFPRYVYTYTP